MSARRWRGVAALIAVVVLALAGCAQLPIDGPVRAGRSEAPPAGPFVFDASRPSPGTQPKELVQGFLQAGAAGMSGDDFEVARTFLTGASASEWAPLSQVLVAANDAPLTPRIVLASDDDDDDDSDSGAGTDAGAGVASPQSTEPDAAQLARADRVSVVVEVVTVGSLDETGAYAPEPGRLPWELTFELVRIEWEWRIEALPPGLLLTEGAFATVFRPVPLAFLSPGRDLLVPDVRYVPTRRAARYALDQLLRGPAPWLVDAVATAVPEGLRVNPGRGVALDEATGTVQVHLTGADVPPDAADLLYAQVRQTLLGIPSVWDVTVWFGSAPYEPPPDARLPTMAREVGASMVALSEGQLVTLAGEAVALYPGFASLLEAADLAAPEAPDEAGTDGSGTDGSGTDGSGTDGGDADAAVGDGTPAIDTSGWRTPTLSYGEDPDVALLAGGDLLLLTSSGQERILASGQGLVPPSFDRFDWVWSGRDGDLIAVPAGGGDPVMVTTMEATGAASDDGGEQDGPGELRGIRVSRDGARALVSRQSGDQVVLSIHGVIRDEANAPVGLGPGVPLAAFGTLLGAVWADAATVVSLGSGPVNTATGAATGAAVVVRTGPATGPMTPLSVTAQPLSVAAGDGVSQIYVASSEGRLMARAATRGWSVVAEHITDPSFPG